ncbi:MAG: ACT domain-containing protein [archaeon]
MSLLELDDYFSNGSIIIDSRRFVIATADVPIAGAFCTISDEKETTVIIAEERIAGKSLLKQEGGWRVITLDIVFPMDVVGVTARVAGALAENGVSVMPLAAYSRDHFLVKEVDLDKAVETFSALGVKERE